MMAPHPPSVCGHCGVPRHFNGPNHLGLQASYSSCGGETHRLALRTCCASTLLVRRLCLAVLQASVAQALQLGALPKHRRQPHHRRNSAS